ncbi:lipoprotein pyruvate-formate lyase [Acetobacter lambici]|uniref:Haloacid dehalogenase-like hydrolase n=1 Tax=Acetobacter lambici TaxID=1332824 RepID=A0ABT1F0D9_9PROT|nr:haloacid dehalogenase-like hydrolase [Acetobacter lambici]MCP1242472.1 haloacid dehalogenase-like hydrolase [Acetobacter lambici]MCP1258662.1 haloacid dehalogenase-like hydrolase [Acetobacter lambici]NHO56952.1 lipoprotein pyruvate-formate lyase [Acetobacter lambici]
MRPVLHRRTFGLGLTALLATPTIGRATGLPDLMDRPPPELEELKWHPPLREAIQALINAHGHYSDTYNGNAPPYVVMDWNNTAIVGDVQQTLFVFMLEHFCFLMPAQKFRKLIHVHASTHPLPAPFANMAGQPVTFPDLVTDIVEDYSALAARYGHMPHPIAREELQDNPAMLAFRARMAFCHQAVAALHGPDAAQQWMIRLVAEQTQTDVIALSRAANEWCLGASITNQKWVCPSSRPGKAGPVQADMTQMLRLTPEMGNLLQILQEHGIDPIICSSALEDLVALFATSAEYGYNLRHEHVFGARLVEHKGVMEPTEAPHYPFPAGAGKTELIRVHFEQKRKQPPLMIFAGESSSADLLRSFPDTSLCCLINRKQSDDMEVFLREAAKPTGASTPRRLYLQGRDENTGEWRPHATSLLLGSTTPTLPT